MTKDEENVLREKITVQALRTRLINCYDTSDAREWAKSAAEHKKAIKDGFLKNMEHENAYYSSLIADAFLEAFEKKKVKSDFVIRTAIEIMPEVGHVYIRPADSILIRKGISEYDDFAHACIKYAEALAKILGINYKL